MWGKALVLDWFHVMDTERSQLLYTLLKDFTMVDTSSGSSMTSIWVGATLYELINNNYNPMNFTQIKWHNEFERCKYNMVIHFSAIVAIFYIHMKSQIQHLIV